MDKYLIFLRIRQINFFEKLGRKNFEEKLFTILKIRFFKSKFKKQKFKKKNFF